MGRGGSGGQHIPPIPDFSGIGRVVSPCNKKDWIERKNKEQKKEERLNVKMN